MTIKEIEERTGLPRASVRFYEKEKLIDPAREENGYRNYSEEDCRLLRKIRLCRELGCSLEEIRQLQAGTVPLEEVLEERLKQMAGEREERERLEALCRKLRADGADWGSLDPENYLDWTPEPVAPEVPEVRFRIPWRRYLARSLDLTFCSAIWLSVVAFGLRQNILGRGPDEILDTAVSLTMMVLLEPLFLHFLGTTPGKALMGLRLTRSDGSLFGYGEGLKRTASVVLMGMGLNVPVLGAICAALSWRRNRKGQEQPWELEEEAWTDLVAGEAGFWSGCSAIPRAIGCVVLFLACEGILMAGQLFAGGPLYRGELTAEQFADNFNHSQAFEEAPEQPALLLQEDGTWEKTDPKMVLVFGGPEPADLTIRTDDRGVVTEVSFTEESREDQGIIWIPYDDAWRIVLSLAGHGSVIPKGDPWHAVQETFERKPAQARIEAPDGWTISWDLESEGYEPMPEGTLFSEEDASSYSYAFTFSMERTPS